MRTSIRFRLFRILAVAIALTMAAGAAAQGAPAAVHKHPFIELGLDYNYVRANAPPADCGCFSMNGGDAWAAYNFTSSLAAVAQFSAHHASNVNGSGADLTLKSYLFGGRYSWRNSSRFMPFGQALFGGSHAGTNLSSGGPVLGNTSNSFALSAGGGLDVSLTQHFAVRAFEADYFRTQFPNGVNDRQNNLRLGAGLILKWGKD